MKYEDGEHREKHNYVDIEAASNTNFKLLEWDNCKVIDVHSVAEEFNSRCTSWKWAETNDNGQGAGGWTEIVFIHDVKLQTSLNSRWWRRGKLEEKHFND